jgi:hypothetical protein
VLPGGGGGGGGGVTTEEMGFSFLQEVKPTHPVSVIKIEYRIILFMISRLTPVFAKAKTGMVNRSAGKKIYSFKNFTVAKISGGEEFNGSCQTFTKYPTPVIDFIHAT